MGMFSWFPVPFLTLSWSTRLYNNLIIIFASKPETKVYILFTQMIVNIVEHPLCSLQDPAGYYKLL